MQITEWKVTAELIRIVAIVAALIGQPLLTQNVFARSQSMYCLKLIFVRAKNYER